MPINLGRLRKVDPRDVWFSEPGDFTPWLAEEQNLALLADTLGLEFELEGQEQSVGPYRADIVCRDLVDESLVLVENQLERTDHGHLGQLMTYAAGLDAMTVVWIARRFTEEHRAALDWLNDITGEGIGFFGLEIELWRIDDSPVAPKFNIVSKPNEWIKGGGAHKVSTGGGAVSETKLLQQEYWAAFKAFLKDRNSPLKPQKASPRHWLNASIGRSYFHLSALVNTPKNRVSVALNLKGDLAKPHYDALYEQKSEIEGQMGASLDWRRLSEKAVSRIQLDRPDSDIEQEDRWPEQFAWLADTLKAMDGAFRGRIKALPQMYPGYDESLGDSESGVDDEE